MSAEYIYVPDLGAHQQVPAKGVLSQTLRADDQAKIVLFGFAAGEELSEHTASVPAIMHFLEGQARVTLGDDTMEVRGGAWIYMPARLRHSITARTPVSMLLTLLEAPAAAP